MPKRYLLLLPLGAVIAQAGCGSCRTTSNFVAQQPYSCNRCLDSVQPPRYNGPPPGRGYAAIPTPPPGRTLPPGPSVEGGSATFVPPSGESAPPPPPPAAIERTEGRTSDGLLGASDPPPAGVQLGPPTAPRRADFREPDATKERAPETTREATKEPPVASVPSGKEMPQAIDLPGFAVAVTGVASGIKPFPDGITWLAEKGYKTALHLRPAAEDTSASQRLFERKGLKYVSLEASPASLTKATYEAFVRQVKDAESHPLFVYDKDGSVAGSLWYLYFRVEKGEADEKARAEAQRLGLRFDDEEHKPMLLAAQKLLSELKP